MHEYSIVGSLIHRVQAEAEQRGATAVTALWVRIGELSGVETDLLETAYDTFRERTICDAATLNLTRVPARWECPRCGRSIETGTQLRCAQCGVPASLAEGDEIVLERIEMEVANV